MHADIQGSLNAINRGRKLPFEHNGKQMKKADIVAVLEYALAKGYKTTNELSDEEVDKILLRGTNNLKDSQVGM